MLEKWKMAVDIQKRFGAHLTDLSKTFECLSNELLIAKLNAYGFSIDLIVENQIIDNSTGENFLGVKFYYKLTFNAHIDDICKKAGLKFNVLSRIVPYMDFNKKNNGY